MEMKNWVTDQRHKEYCVSKKIIYVVRCWKVACGIADFDRIASSCYIFIYRHELNKCTQTRIAQKIPAKKAYKTDFAVSQIHDWCYEKLHF